MKVSVRKELHDLVDRLPDGQTAVAAQILESLAKEGNSGRTPVAALPLDEEELSEEARRAVEEGIADHAAGRTHTSDDVKRELGL